MTVVYTHKVATGSKGFGNFRKLLFWWKGSIYKLVLPDLCVYAVLYYIINFVYRFYLKEDPDKREFFHLLVEYCSDVSNVIPLRFVLGFYVSQVVTRWWNQYMTTPWPDTLAVAVSFSVRGQDERGRMMRRTILRYVNLTMVMVFTMISPQARSRFPTLDHLVESGFLVPHERIIIDHLNEKSEGPKYFVPVVWAGAVATRARKEGRIRDDVALYCIIKELCKYRNLAGDLLSYDWICIPIVYTQVAALCTYVYFLACLFGRQMIAEDDKIDIYFPLFHFLEFFFMMGWLKVAETMINPFGADDDDFEVNWLIDRNIKISYMIVDEMHAEFPEMLKDAYWDDVIPDDIPYTQEALKFKTEGMGQGSAAMTSSKDDLDRHAFSAAPDHVSQTRSGKTMMRGFSLPFHFHIGDRHHSDKQQPKPQQKPPEKQSQPAPETASIGTFKSTAYDHLLEKSFVPHKKDSADDLIRVEEKKSTKSVPSKTSQKTVPKKE